VKAAWARCIALAIRSSGSAVAIKILPDAFVTDHERVARFEREAKAVETDNDSVETRVQPFKGR
jgi:hypothetical protein